MADKFELTDGEPAAPSGKANVKWQSDINGNISAYVEPSAAQTPWAQDIDAASHDLNNLKIIRFISYEGEGPICAVGNLAGTYRILTDNGGSIDIESIGTGRVMISTDSIRRLVVRQNGNVGIGPSMNPSYTLDIQGNCSISAGLILLNLPTVGTGPSGTVWRDASAGNVLKIVP